MINYGLTVDGKHREDFFLMSPYKITIFIIFMEELFQRFLEPYNVQLFVTINK